MPDRAAFTTTPDETEATSPPGLQAAVAAAAAAQPGGRAFVRPSGTEDVVRVYAEAASEEGAGRLAAAVVEAVTRLAGV